MPKFLEVEHFSIVDFPVLLQETENGRNLPGSTADPCIEMTAKGAGHITRQSATRDMAHGGDDTLDPVFS